MQSTCITYTCRQLQGESSALLSLSLSSPKSCTGSAAHALHDAYRVCSPMCRSVGLLDEALGCNATLLGEGVHLYTTAHGMGMSRRN